jgi:hypothetical protein
MPRFKNDQKFSMLWYGLRRARTRPPNGSQCHACSHWRSNIRISGMLVSPTKSTLSLTVGRRVACAPCAPGAKLAVAHFAASSARSTRAGAPLAAGGPHWSRLPTSFNGGIVIQCLCGRSRSEFPSSRARRCNGADCDFTPLWVGSVLPVFGALYCCLRPYFRWIGAGCGILWRRLSLELPDNL